MKRCPRDVAQLMTSVVHVAVNSVFAAVSKSVIKALGEMIDSHCLFQTVLT